MISILDFATAWLIDKISYLLVYELLQSDHVIGDYWRVSLDDLRHLPEFAPPPQLGLRPGHHLGRVPHLLLLAAGVRLHAHQLVLPGPGAV